MTDTIVPNPLPDWFPPADPEDLRRERNKARELRASQWWKNQLGRGRCHYCGKNFPPRELTMDHVVPVSRGGRSTRGNVVPCCKACNSAKQSQLPVERGEAGALLRRPHPEDERQPDPPGDD